jgi:hypothetical protein
MKLQEKRRVGCFFCDSAAASDRRSIPLLLLSLLKAMYLCLVVVVARDR